MHAFEGLEIAQISNAL